MLENEVRKFLGLAPYNSPTNFVVGDPQFYNSLVRRYGEKAVKKMIEKLGG